MTASEPPRISADPAAPDRSLSDLLGDLTDEIRALFQKEVELAKVELKQEATKAGKASGKLVAGAVVAFMAWLLLSIALAWLIALVTPIWVGFLIVGALYAVIGAVLMVSGRKQIQNVEPTPDRAVAEAKETKQWAQERT